MMRSSYLIANYKLNKAERKDRYAYLRPNKPVHTDFSSRAKKFREWLPYSLFHKKNELSFELVLTPFSHEVLSDIHQSKLDLLEKIQKNIISIDDKDLLFHYIVDVEGPYSHIISNPLQKMTGSLSDIKSKMLARVVDECRKMQVLHEGELKEYLDFFASAQSLNQSEEREQKLDKLYMFLLWQLAYEQQDMFARNMLNIISSKDTFTHFALLKEMLAYIQPWTSIALKNHFLSTSYDFEKVGAGTALKIDPALNFDKSKLRSLLNGCASLVRELASALYVYDKLRELAPEKVSKDDGFYVKKVFTDLGFLRKNFESVQRNIVNINDLKDLYTIVQLLNAIGITMPALQAAKRKLVSLIEDLVVKIPDEVLNEAKSDKVFSSVISTVTQSYSVEDLKTKLMSVDLVDKTPFEVPEKAKSEKVRSSVMSAVTQSDRVEDLKDQEVLTKLDVTVAQEASKYDPQPPQPEGLVKSRHVVSRAELKAATQLVKIESQDRGFLGISRKSLKILTDIAEGSSQSLHNCYRARELFAVIKDLGGKLKNIRGSHYTFKLNQHSFVIVKHPRRGMKKLSGTYMMDFKWDLKQAGIKLKSLCELYGELSL